MDLLLMLSQLIRTGEPFTSIIAATGDRAVAM